MEIPKKIIFARIGWMKHYSGSRSDDERPTGGGSYNEIGLGSEICNFKDIAGEIYGFFSPPGRDTAGKRVVNLNRIAPSFTRDELSDVTVIFVAPDDTADVSTRERIIGWYRHAKVLRVWQDDPTGLRWTIDQDGEEVRALYNVVVKKKDAVLVPPSLRRHSIPRGKGGMGQANVRYLYDDHGKIKLHDWMKNAIEYVKSYNGENLLTNPLAEMAIAAQAELEVAAGYESNPKIRRAVEERAMDAVKEYYLREGYAVVDKSRTESFDLLCEKSGVKLFVEVKGTRADGKTISLTAKEVELAARPQVKMELCVVHSIEVSNDKQKKAKGGALVRYKCWNPKDHDLQPIQYVCRLIPT